MCIRRLAPWPIAFAGLLALLCLTALPLRAQVTFTLLDQQALQTPVRSWAASWVDYDGDGDHDLFVSRQATGNGNVLLQNDGGTFNRARAGQLTDFPAEGSLGHTWGDYDNDGDLDVYTVGGWESGAGRLLRNDGDTFVLVEQGPLAPNADNRGWGAAWGDYDADGFIDLVIAHPQGFVGTTQTNHLFRNDGGSFVRVTGTPITDGFSSYTIPSWSDHDLDGDVDLFIGSGPISVLGEDHLYENLGGGEFARITEGIIATDARDGQVMNWVDVDNDADLDLFVTNFRGGPAEKPGEPDALYLNNGDGTFARMTEGPLVTDVTGVSLANTWGDVDNDGDLDVFIAVGGTPGTDRLYLNDGTGSFALGLSFENEGTAGATLGDYDQDGDLDLAATVQTPGGGPVLVYRNDTENENNWFQLDLAGTASNRAAIGARVTATAVIGGETLTQLREVSAQNTFGGQNALTVHFGLGDATEVGELRIAWPSGAEDVHTTLPVNQRIELTEGEGVSSAPQPALPRQGGMTLHGIYPNPIADAGTIDVSVVRPGHLRIDLYDVLGRRVTTLADHEAAPGRHTVSFRASGRSATPLPAGPYVCVLRFDDYVVSRLMMLVPARGPER